MLLLSEQHGLQLSRQTDAVDAERELLSPPHFKLFMSAVTHGLLEFAASKVKQSARRREHATVPSGGTDVINFLFHHTPVAFISVHKAAPFVSLDILFFCVLGCCNFKLRNPNGATSPYN